MNLPSLRGLLPSWGKRSVEGEWRPGPYLIDGGWLSAKAGQFWNWWQLAGYGLQQRSGGGAMVEACVSAYSQTIAMCPGDHWRRLPNGGRERVTTSALSRVIRQPNDYQSMSDLLLNMARRLYTDGEAFAVGPRDGNNEIKELHWMSHGMPVVALDGSIFYQLYGNDVAERRYDFSRPIPARDVLHVRLHTVPGRPLKGLSPILAVALEREMSGAALSQQVAFYLNQARPSFILETDQQLTKQQANDLRARWDEQTQGENAGGTPILSWGLKAKPITVGAGDANLVEMMKLTNENIALAFRVPFQILGIGDKSTYASTEALMSSWKAMGLGFALGNFEDAIGRLFGLRGMSDEYVEFDTNILLRSSFKEMIDALAAGTRRVMTSNEARRYLDLPDQAGGDELLVQMQDIPLSMAGKQQSPPSQPALPPPAKGIQNASERDQEYAGTLIRFADWHDRRTG